MNVPRPDEGLLGLLGLSKTEQTELVMQLGADAVVATSYLLLLLTIVYLNRQKHVALYLPRNSAWTVFGAVFGLASLASLSALALPPEKVLFGYKLFVAGLMLVVIVGVLRLVPRDIDPVERARLARENVVLRETERRLRDTDSRLREFEAGVQTATDERITVMAAEKLALEKEIIERRLIEERAVEGKRRLEELIMRTGTALAVLDNEGRVIEANLALAQFLGRAGEEEVIGRDLGRLLGLKDDVALRHFLREVQRQGTHWAEMDASPPDRGKVAFEAGGVTTVVDGRACVTALIWDVTERHAAARELMKSREAMAAALTVTRKANASRSDFLAKMNHELRTPLNGIIGLAEILRHKAKGTNIPSAEVRKLVNNIHQSGRHLLSVVDDLLDLSRLDAGARDLTPVPVTVRAEIEAALATLGTIAQKKRISLENHCRPGLDWTVDQRAFKQVLINLVNNAVKFSPPGKRVWVEVGETPDSLSLHVRDEGPGISAEDQERILEPFGRGTYATDNKIDGVGLGLAIVVELMKLQGGRIEIDSQPNQGATFTAVFPRGDDMPEMVKPDDAVREG